MNDLNGWPDGDCRHVFLPTVRDKTRCHLCHKSQHHIDHVSQLTYDRLRADYALQQALTPDD